MRVKEYSRRDFVKLACWGTAALTLPQISCLRSKAKKPNVLFIAVDDLRTELGCYGNPHIKSPNIDRLAESGVVFNRAYCQQAVCNPSRASLLTGLRPDSIKVWDLITHFRDTVPDVVTLPQYFKINGYYTAGIGKIFHSVYGKMEDPISWTIPKMRPKVETKVWSHEILEEHKKFLEQYRTRMEKSGQTPRAMRATATSCEDVPDNLRFDGAQTDVTIEKLRELKDHPDPFFLAVGYVKPHLPFVAPKKYWDLYDRNTIPLAKNDFLPEGSPPMAMNTMYELRDYMDFLDTPPPQDGPLSDENQRLLKHGYYACVSFVDAQIGRVINELSRLDLRENTIIILWGDHGWKLGEHRSWCKQTNYENDTRAPLIICAPHAKAKGKSTDALVEFLDIYPTLCDLADLPLPEHLEGRSMKPLLNQPNKPWKKGAFSQFYRTHGGIPCMGHSIRTDRYRYVEWCNLDTGDLVATELYDHQNDPQENINIAGKPENDQLVVRLHKQLRKTCPSLPPGPKARGRKSGDSDKEIKLLIKNQLDETVTIYWIDQRGRRRKQCELKPNEEEVINTFYTYIFVAVSQSGTYDVVIQPEDYIAKPAILKK